MSRTSYLENCIFYMSGAYSQGANDPSFCYFHAKDIEECDRNCLGFVDKCRALNSLSYAIKKEIKGMEEEYEDKFN